jgi:hypothetical protein
MVEDYSEGDERCVGLYVQSSSPPVVAFDGDGYRGWRRIESGER